MLELAQAAWLNAQLHDDVVAEEQHLPPLPERARQLRAMVVEGYQLPGAKRAGFMDLMIDFVAHDTADEADQAGVMPGALSG